jgi:alpha-methylacyl-CoA racemase
MGGPLAGIRVIEFAGIGPAPFCAMLLADMGADIVRIDRIGRSPKDVTSRGRRSLELDLKHVTSREICLKMIAKADVLIEGFRPGVMERLGLGPAEAMTENPRLIYGRMTGWGQEGPLARAAGHDINYISLTGALASIGTVDAPVPPLNVLGDYGGGALYLAFGIAAALYERTCSGKGQVIDAAVVDGTASLMSIFHDPEGMGLAGIEHSQNMLAGSAPFYGVYRCADNKFISLGAIEPQFYELMLEKIGVAQADLGDRSDPRNWPEARKAIGSAISKRSRSEWVARLEGTDVCFAPVLTLGEVMSHPHNQARDAFVEVDGIIHPAPAPRFSRTPGVLKTGRFDAGKSGWDTITEWGVDLGQRDVAVAKICLP